MADVRSNEELEAIVLAVRLTGEPGDASLEHAARDVIAKVRAMLPRERRRVVDENAFSWARLA